MTATKNGCVFCAIVRGERDAAVVLEDEACLAFLDHRPLFPGHVLLIPRAHHETLVDLPPADVSPLFANARLLAAAVERGLEAEGTFVALNNRISQSVPHLHVHVVPRRRRDGLRGFFWPRTHYDGAEHVTRVRDAIRTAVEKARGDQE
jgi:histidine triad (HIT) family protein